MTIEQIQAFLNNANKNLPGWVPLVIDGKNGVKTQATIKAYQSANGLVADGIVGPKTLAVMNTAPTSNTGSSSGPFDSNQDSYVVQPGDTHNPYNGQSLNGATPGTVIQKSGGNSGSGVSTSTYGQPERNSDWEGAALQQEKWITDAAKSSNLISSSFMSKISSDPSLVGFYVNALAYGGYTIGDVLNDMKRRELADKGDAKAKALKIIDPEMNRTTYQQTSEGQRSVTDTATIIPTFNLQGLMNPEILKYGANIPDELFKTLVPLLDRDSEEFKDAVENVKSAFYDLANAQLQATTEQEKAVADYNYKNFKEQINEQYGILLSDDASKAWKQIEDLRDNMSGRGIAGSGIEAEGIDDILKDARKQDQGSRISKLTKEEEGKAVYYTSYASAAEIATLSDDDKEKYGLKPSADILSQYDMANLKKKYPNQSEEELKAYRDSVLDENGNYRSTLYANKFTKMSANTTAKKSMAETQVLNDSLNKEAAAYRNYDQTNPFSGATKNDISQMKNDAEANPNPPNQAEEVKTDPNTINYNTNDGTKLKPGESFVDKKTGKTLTQGQPTSTQQYVADVKANVPAVTSTNTGSLSIAQIQKIVGVKEDGINGPKTQAAIKAYQSANGLVADGIVGPKTTAAMQGGSNSGSTSLSTPKQPISTTPISAAYNPNNGSPLYVGQTTTFEGKTYTGSTPKTTTTPQTTTPTTTPKITIPKTLSSSSSGGSSGIPAAFNPKTGKPLYVNQTTTFEGKTYVGTTPR